MILCSTFKYSVYHVLTTVGKFSSEAYNIAFLFFKEDKITHVLSVTALF